MAATRSTLLESPLTPLLTYDGYKDELISMVALSPSVIEIPTFQRDRKQAHIQKLVAEWDETAYAFPLVAHYKDRFFALDGQQRIAAAEILSLEKITVLLLQGVRTHERLAQIFLRFNRDRKLLDAFEKYFSAVEAKERGSVEIKRKLAEYGLEGAKSAKANGKVPIGAIVQIHDRGGLELLDRVLSVRTHAWKDPSREANEGKTLLGLSVFLKRHWDRVDDGRLVMTLSKKHPGYLLSATDPERGSFRAAYADYLRKLYNQGLRGKSRLSE